MELKKKEAKIVGKAVDQWEDEELLDEETADVLRDSYEVKSFNWALLAKYAFWGAIASFVVAIGALLADDLIVEVLEVIFASDALSVGGLSGVAAGIFYYGFRRAEWKPKAVYSTEAIYALGAIVVVGAVFFFGRALLLDGGEPPPVESNDLTSLISLILLTSVVYGTLAVLLPSTVLWVGCLLALGSWFAAVTGYHYGTYFLGMNYPLRFVLFGGVLVAASSWLEKTDRTRSFSRYTYIIGLLYLFIALWILSIFGNYGEMGSWYDAEHLVLLWSLLFAAVAAGAIGYGLRYGDATARKFGVTFLFINAYTKFFEFFWDGVHKAILFAFFGLSLWLIGQKAESIWELKFLRNRALGEREG